MHRRRLQIYVACGVALVGAVVVGLGVMLGTVWKAPTESVVRVGQADGIPLVTTAPGALSLDGTTVLVEAFAESSQPVFIGVGRTRDVEAYAADVSRQVLTGIAADGAPMLRREGSQSSGADPVQSDVWVASAVGAGSASLRWPEQEGSWTLVAATNGTGTGPSLVRFTWPLDPPASQWPFVVGVGALVLIAGVVTLLLVLTRSREEVKA